MSARAGLLLLLFLLLVATPILTDVFACDNCLAHVAEFPASKLVFWVCSETNLKYTPTLGT